MRYFVEVFTADLLEKKSKLYHLPVQRYSQNKTMFSRKISTSKTCFAFFSEHGFDEVAPTPFFNSTIWSEIFFFVWKLVSGANPPRGPFFKISLLLSYKSSSLQKEHHFLGGVRVIELFIRLPRLKGGIKKKGHEVG